MIKINKYELNSNVAIDYIIKNLDGTNELSSQILNIILYNSGVFYALLPGDTDLKKIHEFNSGYITPSIDKEICNYIVNIIKSKKFSCIFDDINTSISDNFQDEFSINHSLFYENEVYYTIKINELSEAIFLKCMAASDGIWHSLCIITKTNLDRFVGGKINQNMIRQICLDAQLVMIGAYDGEGYIFWERVQ